MLVLLPAPSPPPPSTLTRAGSLGNLTDALEGEHGGAAEQRFPVRAMNVMHPLDRNENLIGDGMKHKRRVRVQHTLSAAAQALRPALSHLAGSDGAAASVSQSQSAAPPNSTTSVAFLETFYTNSWSRFGAKWRLDAPSRNDAVVRQQQQQRELDKPADALSRPLAEFREKIEYVGERSEPGPPDTHTHTPHAHPRPTPAPLPGTAACCSRRRSPSRPSARCRSRSSATRARCPSARSGSCCR